MWIQRSLLSWGPGVTHVAERAAESGTELGRAAGFVCFALSIFIPCRPAAGRGGGSVRAGEGPAGHSRVAFSCTEAEELLTALLGLEELSGIGTCSARPLPKGFGGSSEREPGRATARMSLARPWSRTPPSAKGASECWAGASEVQSGCCQHRARPLSVPEG